MHVLLHVSHAGTALILVFVSHFSGSIGRLVFVVFQRVLMNAVTPIVVSIPIRMPGMFQRSFAVPDEFLKPSVTSTPRSTSSASNFAHVSSPLLTAAVSVVFNTAETSTWPLNSSAWLFNLFTSPRVNFTALPSALFVLLGKQARVVSTRKSHRLFYLRRGPLCRRCSRHKEFQRTDHDGYIFFSFCDKSHAVSSATYLGIHRLSSNSTFLQNSSPQLEVWQVLLYLQR